MTQYDVNSPTAYYWSKQMNAYNTDEKAQNYINWSLSKYPSNSWAIGARTWLDNTYLDSESDVINSTSSWFLGATYSNQWGDSLDESKKNAYLSSLPTIDNIHSKGPFSIQHLDTGMIRFISWNTSGDPSSTARIEYQQNHNPPMADGQMCHWGMDFRMEDFSVLENVWFCISQLHGRHPDTGIPTVLCTVRPIKTATDNDETIEGELIMSVKGQDSEGNYTGQWISIGRMRPGEMYKLDFYARLSSSDGALDGSMAGEITSYETKDVQARTVGNMSVSFDGEFEYSYCRYGVYASFSPKLVCEMDNFHNTIYDRNEIDINITTE